jgi:GNAT superfamily N-acetyltransferase
MEIRTAISPADFDAFRALADDYEAALPEALRHEAWPAERDDVARHYGAPHTVLLAREGSRDIGCVVMAARDADSVVVKKLYVCPEGRAAGTGRALMDALIAQARERGCARVLLDTHAEELPAAYRLYQRLGFRDRAAYECVDYGCATFMELHLR